MKYRFNVHLLFLLLGVSCTPNLNEDSSLKLDDCSQKTTEVDANKRFSLLPCSRTGIEFRNDVDDLGKYTPHNTYYIYNGGGVAVGDIDNDGLDDLLFSSNQNGCSLYRNLGEFRFTDITEKSGIAYSESWTTGVCMVDINSDGWMDLHICRSGLAADTSRANLLFINNGDGTFTEQAREYGLNDNGTSTQIYFFDLDKDEDLDAYVLNHPVDYENAFDPLFHVRTFQDSIYSNRFYLNENGKYVESNKKLGVGMEKGFSLSASIGDINNDGWPDVYVANDFISPDYYYINQEGKGFEDSITEVLDKTTLFSMGSDLSDVNNDGQLDLIVADMEPGDHFRRKMNDFSLDKSYYDLLKYRFFYPQFSRNMFFIGSTTGFKEIAELAGVSMTDWTWTTLFEDLDNDGYKDLFSTNGTKRDFHDQDYMGLNHDQSMVASKKRHDAKELITKMPTSLLYNHTFKNTGGIQFEDVSEEWGLDMKLNGQGAVVADLNNDGAMDIVVNNTDAVASIYRNNSNSDKAHIQVNLVYQKPNMVGFGSKIEVWAAGKMQLKYQYLNRGFQSSMSPVLHFGVGKSERIDSVVVVWPNGEIQNEVSVATGQRIKIEYAPNTERKVKKQAEKWFDQEKLEYIRHFENDFDEIQRDRVVPFGQSRSGPALAAGDLNGDGLSDLVVGSSIGYGIQVLFGKPDGDLVDSDAHLPETVQTESTAILLVDLDNDGDLDLYVGNGSNEVLGLSDFLKDIVYLNNGEGVFELAPDFGPSVLLNTQCAVAMDLNNDGTQDVFIGGGFVPGVYGESIGSRILLNKDGKLTDATDTFAPELKKVGAIKSAAFADLNNDGVTELIAAGPWEPIRRFTLSETGLKESTPVYSKSGLWNKLVLSDLNSDGFLDIIAGNYGLNGFFKASQTEPMELFMTDFDDNGTPDPIVIHYLKNKQGTFIGKDDLCEKMPDYNNRFLTYDQFANADISEIVKGKNMDHLVHRKIQELRTIALMNDGNGNFSITELPIEAQFAPVKAICVQDVSGDKNLEILLLGNSDSEFYDLGNITANHGCVLQVDEAGNYVAIPSTLSGIDVKGVVNSCVQINGEKRSDIILGRNNDKLVKLSRSDGH